MTDAKTNLFKPGDRVYFKGWTPPSPDYAPAEDTEWGTVVDEPTGNPDRTMVLYDSDRRTLPALTSYLLPAADAPEVDPRTPVDVDVAVSRLVREERARQDARWGAPKELPNGTGPDTHPLSDLPFAITEGPAIRGVESWTASMLADAAKRNCDIATDQRLVTYADILTEEHLEALAEDDPEKLFDELIQVAAVAQKWCRALIEHQGVQR